MRKYKTWEVVKMLEENPNLKFKEYRWSGVLERELFSDKKALTMNVMRGDNGKLFTDSEWILIQQDVTFIEAFNSKKRIKPVNVDDKGFQYPIYWLGYIVSSNAGNYVGNELINGKWYIEEE